MPKQYQTVGRHPMLRYSLAAFDACSEFAQTLVVLAPGDHHFDDRRFAGLRFAVQRCGGTTRQASVFNGLAALTGFGARDDDWVLVHDAARPGLTPGMIRRLVAELKNDPVGASWRCRSRTRSSVSRRKARPMRKGALPPRSRVTACGRHRRRRCSGWACCATRSRERSRTATISPTRPAQSNGWGTRRG